MTTLRIPVHACGALRSGAPLLRRPFHACKVCGELFDEGDEVAELRFERGTISIHLGCAKADGQ